MAEDNYPTTIVIQLGKLSNCVWIRVECSNCTQCERGSRLSLAQSSGSRVAFPLLWSCVGWCTFRCCCCCCCLVVLQFWYKDGNGALAKLHLHVRANPKRWVSTTALQSLLLLRFLNFILCILSQLETIIFLISNTDMISYRLIIKK